MRSLASLAIALSLCTGCGQSKPAMPTQESIPTMSAQLFTSRYATSRLSSWNVRASAAGPECDVLRIEVNVVLEDAMVQAMHYGEAAYDVYEGGVKQFAAERNFNGVVYLDPTGKRWKFGAVPRSLQPCRD
ncbi:MAG TPA: hypothetical protein VGF48_04705 [Thermoanaerobaculia bacterium]|jgi:hypothetical protein